MMSLVSGDDGGEGGKREMDTGERHQVGLEFVQVDVQRTIKSERGGDGRDDLGNQTVKVGEAWGADSQVLLADIIDSLVVNHERTVTLLQRSVRSQDRVVWLNNGRGNLGSWVHRKLELALLAIVNRKALHKKGAEAGTCTASKGVEDKETLESRAVIYIKQESEVFLK